jgi:hypothetical protein
LIQAQYVKALLQRFDIRECKPVLTAMGPGMTLGKDTGIVSREDRSRKALYQDILGSLLHLSSHARLVVALFLSVLSRFMQNPTDVHFIAAKRILRHLKGTIDWGFEFAAP